METLSRRLWLILWSVFYLSSCANSEDCQTDPLVNNNIMQYGLDLRHYRVYPPERLEGHDNGIRRPVLEFTCEKGLHHRMHGKPYIYPDQFTPPLSDPVKEYDENVVWSSSIEDFRKLEHTGTVDWLPAAEGALQLADKYVDTQANGSKLLIDPETRIAAEAKTATLKLAIGAAKTAANLFIPPSEETIKNYKNYREQELFYTTQKLNIHYVTMSLDSPIHLKLNEDFAKDIKALPLSFLNDTAAYMKFIENYGTHYAQKASFGGVIRCEKTYDITKFNEDSREAINREARGIYNKKQFEKSSNLEENDFRKKTELRVYGGNTSLVNHELDPNKIQQWEDSVFADFHARDIIFRPISELILDDLISNQVSQAIVYAIREDSFQKSKQILENINPSWLTDGSRISYEKVFNPINELFQNFNPTPEKFLTEMDGDIFVRVQDLAHKYELMKVHDDMLALDEEFDLDIKEFYKCLQDVGEVDKFGVGFFNRSIDEYNEILLRLSQVPRLVDAMETNISLVGDCTLDTSQVNIQTLRMIEKEVKQIIEYTHTLRYSPCDKWQPGTTHGWFGFRKKCKIFIKKTITDYCWITEARDILFNVFGLEWTPPTL